jgi:hypothetical protein
MDIHPNLCRQVGAGHIIKPWLVLGPFYEDVSSSVPGMSLYEAVGGQGGRRLIEEVSAEVGAFLTTCRPHEGDRTESFRGHPATWTLMRGPEEFLTWGGYYAKNHLAVTLISTLITPDQAGRRKWRLDTRMAEAVIVTINRKLVFESGIHPATIMEGLENATYTFEAELAAGENQVSIAIIRIGRMARTGLRLEVIDGDVTTRVALGQTLSVAERSQIEAQVHGIRLERDILYPEHAVILHLDVAPSEAAPLVVRLGTTSDKLPHEIRPKSAGPLNLGQASCLPDGTYAITCQWLTTDGQVLVEIAYRLQKTTPTPALEGYENLAQRKQMILEYYAKASDPRPIWNQVARYALGRYEQIDEAVLQAACEFIAARHDTSDFIIQAILRLLYWERKQPRLSPTLRALMKETVLGFKYWVDEPGDTVMWMDSENHRFLFHTAEWLAGQLYPMEEFSNSRQRGLFHALKGRTYATEWMRQRGLYGFDEWHSNTYYPPSIMPLLNVYDFAPYEDHKYRLLAGAVLDYAFFNLAADSFAGVFGTPHGRTYTTQLIHPDFESTSPLAWLAYGQGALRSDGSAMGPVALATSTYRLPPILAAIASDRSSVIESRVRQGIASKGEQEFFALNRDRFADFRVYRTPDYLMSGLQDYRKGEYEPAVHVAQVTLGNKALIFWSCPYTCNEGGGLRPDYWSGNTTMPRVVQHQNVMALTFRLDRQAWMSHCFFEVARFDEVRYAGPWVFGRVKDGYVGIWSQNGYQSGDYGQYAGRELICEAAENTWVVEGGRAADWGSFDAFCNALQSAAIGADKGIVSYDSPAVGRFVSGWDVTPTVNGSAIQLHEYPLVDSPWAHADFGSGCLKIRYGDLKHELYFG